MQDKQLVGRIIRDSSSLLPVPTSVPINFILNLNLFLFLHFLGFLINITDLLRIREANFPIPRRRLGSSPSLPVPRDGLLVSINTCLTSRRIRIATHGSGWRTPERLLEPLWQRANVLIILFKNIS